MRRFILTLAIGLFCNSINAQITGPDTVYVGIPAQFTSSQSATSYTWTIGDVDVNQTPGNQTVVSSSPLLGAMAYATMNNDNGHYYSFTTNYFDNTVVKLDYGNSPLNSPTVTSMGTFGMTNGSTDGIDVVKDDTGNWYGLVVNGPQMVRLNFGTSLANTPTSTIWNYPGSLSSPHHLIIKHVDNEWIAFVANRGYSVSRFDFGTSLNNTPTSLYLPFVGGISSPSNLAVYQQGDGWHMLVTNLTDNTLTKLTFGSDLTNNSPVGFDLGNINTEFDLPRGIGVMAGCDQQLYSYIQNQDGLLNILDFQGNMNNPPTLDYAASGSAGSIYNTITSFTYNGVLYYLTTHTGSTLYRFEALTYPTQTVTNYYDNNYTHTFTTQGNYTLTLHGDQGSAHGASSSCKEIVVLDSTLKVNTIAKQQGLYIYPNPNNGSFMLNGTFSTAYNTATIQVIDLVGKTILNESIPVVQNKLSKAVSLANLPSGSYFIRVSTPDNSQTIPFSKQ